MHKVLGVVFRFLTNFSAALFKNVRKICERKFIASSFQNMNKEQRILSKFLPKFYSLLFLF